MSVRTTLPNRRQSETHKLYFNGRSVFVSIGYYDDGTPGEVFINTAKAGSEYRDMLSSMGMVISFALQCGADQAALATALMSTGRHQLCYLIGELLLGNDQPVEAKAFCLLPPR